MLDGAVPVEPALIESQPTRAVSVAIHREPQACSGPLLADVMRMRGAPSTGDLRGAASAMAVAIAARDGYRVAFILGELVRCARSMRQVAKLRLFEVR